MSGHDEPFYGEKIDRKSQEEHINSILEKYKGEEVTDELQKKIYDELMWEKHLGKVTIPFTVSRRRYLYEGVEDKEYIEVLLDTKV